MIIPGAGWLPVPIEVQADFMPVLEDLVRLLREHGDLPEEYVPKDAEDLLRTILVNLVIPWENVPDPGLCDRRRN
jgi:hypothetical protein